MKTQHVKSQDYCVLGQMSCYFAAEQTYCPDLKSIRVTTKAPGSPTPPEAINHTWRQSPDDSSLDTLNLLVC
jgi:hypothetical protein